MISFEEHASPPAYSGLRGGKKCSHLSDPSELLEYIITITYGDGCLGILFAPLGSATGRAATRVPPDGFKGN